MTIPEKPERKVAETVTGTTQIGVGEKHTWGNGKRKRWSLPCTFHLSVLWKKTAKKRTGIYFPGISTFLREEYEHVVKKRVRHSWKISRNGREGEHSRCGLVDWCCSRRSSKGMTCKIRKGWVPPPLGSYIAIDFQEDSNNYGLGWKSLLCVASICSSPGLPSELLLSPPKPQTQYLIAIYSTSGTGIKHSGSLGWNL